METKARWKSKTIIGGIISLISMVLVIAEVDVDQGMITEVVNTSFAAIGAILVFIGRIRATKKIG